MAADSGIVVPLDGSRIAENAVPFAALLAKAYGEPVRFVHVLEGVRVASAEDRERAASTFARYAQELAARWGIEHSTADILDGQPAASILAFGAEARCFVIASHGRGGFRATVVGSVADKVVRGTTKPVFFIPGVGKPSEASLTTIVVALDGSPEAERALEPARDLAARTGANVALVRGWQLPPPGGFEYSYYTEDLIGTFQSSAEQYIALVTGEGETGHTSQGSPAVVVEEAAARLDASLVVVTSSGKGLAKRLALGSVTDRLMHSLHRPLLIIPSAQG